MVSTRRYGTINNLSWLMLRVLLYCRTGSTVLMIVLVGAVCVCVAVNYRSLTRRNMPGPHYTAISTNSSGPPGPQRIGSGSKFHSHESTLSGGWGWHQWGGSRGSSAASGAQNSSGDEEAWDSRTWDDDSWDDMEKASGTRGGNINLKQGSGFNRRGGASPKTW